MADGGIQHRGGPLATRDMGSSGCRLATDSLSALGDRHPELTPRRLAPIGQTAEASLQRHWNRGGNGWPRAWGWQPYADSAVLIEFARHFPNRWSRTKCHFPALYAPRREGSWRRRWSDYV